ncbi:unnamed protein product [Sphagnum compactum]
MDRDGRRNQSGSGFKFNSTSCRSPPSPEPLSPWDAFKKRSKSTTSFPSETEADKSDSRSFGRDPSFSEHDRAFLPSLFGSQDEPPEPDPSKVVAKLKEEALASSWKELPMEELLRSMGVAIPLTPSSLESSFALEVWGQATSNSTELVPQRKVPRLLGSKGLGFEIQRALGPAPPFGGIGSVGHEFPSNPASTRSTATPHSGVPLLSPVISSSLNKARFSENFCETLAEPEKKVNPTSQATNAMPHAPTNKSQQNLRSSSVEQPNSQSSRNSARSALLIENSPPDTQLSSLQANGEVTVSFSNSTGSSYSGSRATNVSDDSRFTSRMSGVSTEIEESPPDTQFPLPHTFPKPKRSEHVQLGGPEEHKNLFLHAFSKNKKGCSFCGKGLRMQEKEVCIVCNSKFCRHCIINAMGSMPEGRKCIGCIGQPPHDSKRPSIGKSSKLLNNLLSNLEVLQIMKAEKECPTNQPQPEQVWVNGACLSAEEMLTLRGCSKPPKPGKYWYDSVTGFWGKDGCRPDRRISPTLKLGGPLMEKASKGNTQVYMNSRELGKIELTVLKMAGVHCLPGTHLWVAEDGSYREEGQTRSKGSLWAHTAVKMLYPFLSLPAPVSSSTGSGEDANDIFPAYPDVVEESQVQKLLLLGYEGSGRSTIFKQAKLLYKHGFTLDERRNLKMLVRSNILQYICILLEARERFEEECEAEIQLRNQIASISLGKMISNGESEEPVSHRTENAYHMEAKLKEEGDYILEIMATGTLESHFPRGTWMEELSPIVKDLCNHTAMKATLQRQAEIPALSHFAGYFLDKVMEILDEDYQPSEDDILRVEGFTQGSGLMDIEFCLEDKVPLSQSCWQDAHSPIGRYQLIRVGEEGKSDQQKWLEMFEDVDAVVFCVAISDYDMIGIDGEGVLCNKIILARDLFQSILKHSCFQNTPFVLFLTKHDLFVEKFNKGSPLTACDWFSDYRPVQASQQKARNQAHVAYQYIVHKFKNIYSKANSCNRKLSTFPLNALDKTAVAEAFQYVQQILKWEEFRSTEFMLMDNISDSNSDS